MNHPHRVLLMVLNLSLLSFFGCSSSEETADQKETPPAVEIKQTSEQQASKSQPETGTKVDTLNVEVQKNQKPSYESKETPPPPPQPMNPTGRYSVQIGAYKMPDGADRVAALVKERFALNVYTILDRADNLYKVMIGDFNTKDEARDFRDEIARKFPSDYKGAWVSENPQK